MTAVLDLTAIAARLGVPAEKGIVRQLLDLMWTDVVGEADVADGHPRFGEHIGMLAFAGDKWTDIQEWMDACSWDSFAEANRIERAAIRRIIEQVLGDRPHNGR